MSDTVKIKLVRSLIAQKPANVKIARALGFRRLHQVLVKKNDPAVMGMIRKAGFMIEILK